MRERLASLLALLAAGCGATSDGLPGDAVAVDAADIASSADGGVDAEDARAEDAAELRQTPPPFVAVTFNTGTSGYGPSEGNDGYHQQQAAWCDEYYGNGLSWIPFVEKTRQWFEETDPDVVVFQEIFWTGECPGIPVEAWEGFVCQDWTEGGPTVAQMILSEDYQLVCNPGKPDKCAAVHARFGTFRGCAGAFCIEGMEGSQVDGCGKGVRIGRGVIDLVGGSSLTLVNVHASSGLNDDDMACRVKQFEQVFVDLGDGAPAANGEWNLVLGDFNTDPVRLADSDPSAARVLDFVGEGKAFRFVTEVGMDVTPTYGPFMNIDHVISDVLVGTCLHPGATEGTEPVMDAMFFDHRPAVCALEMGP